MKILWMVIAFALFFEASSLVCPDLSTCFFLNTCCPAFSGFGCCPFPLATCCSNRKTCCPTGFLCTDGILCFKKPGPKDVLPVKCEDGRYYCPPRQKCCPNESKTGGCCLFSNRVDCGDGTHYCPPGTKCDKTENTCIGIPEMSKSEEFVLSLSLSPANESAYMETPWFTKGEPTPMPDTFQ